MAIAGGGPPDGKSHIVTVAEPVGPCLLITPWNVPLAMAARKAPVGLAHVPAGPRRP